MEKRSRLPKEFEETLKLTLASSFDDFIDSLEQPAPVSIRVNPHKPTPPRARPVPWSDYGHYLNERPVFTLDPLFHAGTYYVQEASSMFLEQALKQSVDLSKPLRVLDLCAAPGGKSTHLLSLLSPESLLVSNEVIRSRATILAENIQKWGHANVVVTNNDPEDFSALEGFFDVIVADAPCSGEGLFRKDPEAIREWSTENVALCAKRQRRILADVWPALKQDGVLLYSTCTYNRLENEDNLLWLHEQYGAESIALQHDTRWGITTVQENNLTGYHFYPHRVQGEGFYITSVRKTGGQREIQRKIKKGLQAPAKKLTESLQRYTTLVNPKFYTWNDTAYMLPESCYHDVEFLFDHLRFVQAGTPIAISKHDKLVPEHGVALSVHVNKDHFLQLELREEDALRYLRKENIDVTGNPKGYTLITHKHIPLGWANVLDNRMNNLYPKAWRIRMSG